MNSENVQFLPARHYFCAQNIKTTFEYADFYAKISLILDTTARNSITQWILVFLPENGTNVPDFDGTTASVLSHDDF